jgi:UDP-galactose transporter B1
MCNETSANNNREGSSSFVGKHRNALKLIICASGICFSYWIYGFLQEKLITKSRLGATFILAIQTVANCFVASIWQRIERRIKTTKTITATAKTTKTKTSNYLLMRLNHPLLLLTSACYVFAMVGSNECLRFVSYPVAVLAKSCKLIPTMVMGSLIERRQYSTQQWIAAIFISSGIALFNYSRLPQKQQDEQQQTSDDNQYWKGMILLFISLCMDGFLGACQGILKRPGKDQRPPTAVETMLYVNLYSLIFLIPMAVTSGQWVEGIRLLKDNEQLRLSLALLNGVVSIGQVFIFLTITWYSSLVTTTITTTRKFFTILFSVLHFGHSFSVGQWTSVAMVFGGLYLSIISGNKTTTTTSTNQKSKTSSEVPVVSEDKKVN